MKKRIKYYSELAWYYYTHYGFLTFLYMAFVEFPICVILVNIKYYIKKPFHMGEDVKVNDYYMKLDPTDKGVSRELFVFGIREPTSTKIMKEIVGKDMVCVDIGANIGYYVILESLQTKRVYAIEPVQENLDFLKENIELNNLDNVQVYRFAIGDTHGIVNMCIPGKKNLSYIVHDNPQREHDPYGSNIQHEEVGMVTLDEFCAFEDVEPDIVRMDVEGHELYILRGMKQTLSRMKQGSWIFIEMHLIPLGDKGVNEIYYILEQNGFKEKYCLREGKNPEQYNYGHLRAKFPGLKFPAIKHTMSFFEKVAP